MCSIFCICTKKQQLNKHTQISPLRLCRRVRIRKIVVYKEKRNKTLLRSRVVVVVVRIKLSSAPSGGGGSYSKQVLFMLTPFLMRINTNLNNSSGGDDGACVEKIWQNVPG